MWSQCIFKKAHIALDLFWTLLAIKRRRYTRPSFGHRIIEKAYHKDFGVNYRLGMLSLPPHQNVEKKVHRKAIDD